MDAKLVVTDAPVDPSSVKLVVPCHFVPGDAVMFRGSSGVSGYVSSIIISRPVTVKYEVTWWDGRTLLSGTFLAEDLLDA